MSLYLLEPNSRNDLIIKWVREEGMADLQQIEILNPLLDSASQSDSLSYIKSYAEGH